MSDYSIRDLIDFSISNEPTKAKEAFNTIMLDKLRDAVEDKKIDVASKFFNSDEDQEVKEE